MNTRELLSSSPLLLDGAMGTELLKVFPERFSSLDELNFSHPEVVKKIHFEYILAGANIIKTNTFNNTHTDLGIKIAEEVIAESKKNVLIAGVIGPRNILSSNYQDLKNGGAHLILYETATHLNDLIQELTAIDFSLPIMVSLSLTQEGRMLSGETLEEAIKALERFDLFSLGLNCSWGPLCMNDHLKRLRKVSTFRTSAHPNAEAMNTEAFHQMAASWLDDELIDIIGGCCGTTPEDISKIRNHLF